MSLIEEFRQLEQTVAAFDSRFSSSDLSTLTNHDLDEIESSRLPLYRLHVNAYQERLRRCEVEEAKEQAKQEQLKARYGYRYPEKEILNAIDIFRVEAYEAGLVHSVFEEYDEETARKKIHKMIPAISEEEIEEYRRNALGISQAQEREETLLETVRNVMKTMRVTASEAMNIMLVPTKIQEKLLARLRYTVS